jgi:glycosyltransferase involved in cell wall biosynthesis
MRIAQCIEVPLFDHGGVEVLVRELIRELHPEGVETFLVTTTPLTKDQSASLPGIKEVFVWDYQAPPCSEENRLSGWLKINQVDLVHFHLGGTYAWWSRSWKHCPIPRLSREGIRCVSTNHGAFSIFDCVASFRPWWFRLLALLPCWPSKLHQLSQVAWESTVSQHDFLAVRRWFFPMRRKFIQLYHSKLKGDEYSSPPHPGGPEVPPGPYIICLGTVGIRKGQDYLVEAFLKIADEVRNWTLVIAGRHGQRVTVEKIERLLGESPHSSRVKMLPQVPDELAEQLLRHSAIFAMPSLREGLGLSLQEAMYAGCACIGSRVGGIPDLIEDQKTGLLVSPANAEELANGLRRLIADETLRTRLGEAARRSMFQRKMTSSNMANTYLGLYREALRNPNKHR